MFPWVRSLGRIDIAVSTEGWKFPAPPLPVGPQPKAASEAPANPPLPDSPKPEAKPPIRTKPTAETLVFKDRLLYLLQPPLDDLFNGRQFEVPFEPFPYQLEGIAFLMPRHSALLADEMGLGKTTQTILACGCSSTRADSRACRLSQAAGASTGRGNSNSGPPDLPFESFGGDIDRRARPGSFPIARSNSLITKS